MFAFACEVVGSAKFCSKKCDTNLDCSDDSDEADCSYLERHGGEEEKGDRGGGQLGFYNRNIIPRNSSTTGEPLALTVSFEVYRTVPTTHV